MLIARRTLLTALLAIAGAPMMGAADDGFDARLIASHNAARASLAVPPLRWDPALAQSARGWADHLATTRAFRHAPENALAPEGENLWAGSAGRFSPEAMVDAWARERRFFKPGLFPQNSTTGEVADVGHYTQLVWRATTAVGCAMARGGGEDILVCRYSQAGNYKGEVPF